jgi:hypothetical protein
VAAEVPEAVPDGLVREGGGGEEREHVLEFNVLLLDDEGDEVVADEAVPGVGGVHESLAIELPQVGLAVLDLDDVVLEQTHLEVLLVDVDGEGVADVLDSEVLADGLELRDEEVVGSGGLFVLAQEVGERLFKDGFRSYRVRIGSPRDS